MRGSLAILIRRDVMYREKTLNVYNNGGLEIFCVTLFCNGEEIQMCNIYNPSKDVLKEELLYYINQLGHKFLLVVDFNTHSPMWDSRGRTNVTGRNIVNVMDVARIRILNDSSLPTYIDRRIGSFSTLDLCLGSYNLIIGGNITRGPDVGSDHFPIYCCFDYPVTKHQLKTRKKWKLDKANWKDWKKMLSDKNDGDEIEPLDVQMKSEILTEKIVNVYLNHQVMSSSLDVLLGGMLSVRKLLP